MFLFCGTCLDKDLFVMMIAEDKFTNNCPANLDPEKDLGCACWMAKHKYGGFMGPFAMLPAGEKPVV